VVGLKVAADIDALRRPDKLIVYVRTLEDLFEAAQRVREHLGGCAVHGVPFTVAIADDGLLSWGLDPPAAVAQFTRTSWRSWVTWRLAEHLTLARETPGGRKRWQTALERVRSDGVDPLTWRPTETIWQRARTSGRAMSDGR
jgi:hypothetical protein